MRQGILCYFRFRGVEGFNSCAKAALVFLMCRLVVLIRYSQGNIELENEQVSADVKGLAIPSSLLPEIPVCRELATPSL